ncbi:GNAT family N-acetyltransferase [Halomarina rubra]|uniref:GNAT family N-acetyltransferase n=1 Tax=Halomarina rubra TaxID=2071873 RepID=A0ABD6AVV3_9EURY|nr:GNAT family N-acetyltransferase [Halomarina rubra]
MELVEATADDLPTLARLWYALATAMEPYAEVNAVAYPDAEAVPEDGFRRHLAADDTTYYLLREGEETVGFLLVRRGEHASRVHSEYLRIVDLFVREGWRDRGYGSTTVERVRAMAREDGVDYLKVACEWHNEDARRFYESSGFEEKRVEYVQRLE